MARKRAEVRNPSRMLVSMIVLVAVFAVAEFAAGIITNSLAILSDAFHMLSDLMGMLIGLAAIRLTVRPTSQTHTYGWQRAEVVGAFANGVFLIAVVFFIILDAIERFIEPPVISDPLLVIIIGVVGLVVNLIGLVLFSSNATLKGTHSHSHSHSDGSSHTTSHDKPDSGDAIENGESCAEAKAAAPAEPTERPHKSANLHAVFIHVLGDALGSVGAIVTGLVVMYVPYDWKYYADPLLSSLLALLILKASMPVVVQSGKLLLQGVPKSIDIEKLSQELLEIEGVDYVGSIHIWTLSPEQYVASVHLDCLTTASFGDATTLVKALFGKYGVANVTVEPHFVDRPLNTDVKTKLHLAKAHGDQFRCE